MKPETKNNHLLLYLPSWKWPLMLSIFLAMVFITGRILGMGRNLSYLLDGSDLLAAGYGLIYIVSYLMIVLAVPVLIIYAGFLWFFRQLFIRLHKTAESSLAYAQKDKIK
jgi:UDP-N-acetylmuramyl pentapeptide phosphotransferase/UDP-N-acetylglucosamine-1-phosphate transferase